MHAFAAQEYANVEKPRQVAMSLASPELLRLHTI